VAARDGEDFSTTAWTLVEQASKDRKALDKLLQRYRPPLWRHLVHTKRLSESEADDVIQEFLTSRVLERELLSQAKRGRGKFRWFLITALNNFLTDRRRSQASRKAAPDRAHAFGPEQEPVLSDAGVDIEFEASWALTVLADAVRRMEAECRSADRSDLWIAFQARACRIMQGQEPLPYSALAESLRARDEKQAANTWGTAQVKFQRILKQVLAEFGAEDVVEELGDLKTAIAACGNELLETLHAELWSEFPAMSAESADGGPLNVDALAGLWDAKEAPGLSKEEQWKSLLQTSIPAISADQAGQTILSLLEDANPPSDLLERIKDFAKDLRGAAQHDTTAEAATALYYLSIAVGLLKAKRLITDQDRSALERGFNWARGRHWVDARSKATLTEASDAKPA
jgi:DNA-directed RNA polymerase specialized sigma24 family protein